MAKTRMLKHDLRTSEKVASWPIEIRYFWVLLWGYVDDHGKAKDNPLLVKADTFPLDPDITGDVIDGWLWRIAEDGVIARYAVDGTDYLQVVNWKEHQKPPHPTADVLPSSSDPRVVVRELPASCMKDAGATHAALTPVLGLGLVGVGSVIESSPAVTDSTNQNLIELFESAYSHWPKKVERKVALERFKSAAKRIPLDTLVQSIVTFGDTYAATTEKQFVPALGVWLNGDRWADDLPTAPEVERRHLSAVEPVRAPRRVVSGRVQ